MTCSATARALTPRALASRTPCCLSASRENWSVPATDRLDEAQPLRARQEVVAPEPRDHQHIGLADPLLEHGAVAHLKALDSYREREETLAQPIGNMGKTDRQMALGRLAEGFPRRHRDRDMACRYREWAMRGRLGARVIDSERLALRQERLSGSRPEQAKAGRAAAGLRSSSGHRWGRSRMPMPAM
jgi:hypothetical protein